MKLKKWMNGCLAMLMASVMAMSLSACGNDKAPAKSGDGTGNENVAENADPYGAYSETVVMNIGKFFGTPVELPDGRSRDDNALRDYIKETLNLEYNFTLETMGAEDYQRQMSLAIASEELPDVMAITDRNVLDELMENDLIADLTDVFNAYAGDYMKEVYNTYNYPILDRVTYDGKMMALPRCAPEMGTLVWIRQDWVDALGLTLDADGDKIISRDELQMVAQEFLEKDSGASGNPVGLAVSTAIGEGSSQTLNAVDDSFGAFPARWLKSEDGTVYNGFASPEMKEALQWWAEMFQEGILDPQFGVRKQEDIIAMLVNGQTGVTFGEWTNPAWQFASIKELNPEAEFTAYCLDNGNGKVNMTILDTSNIWFVVRKDYEHPEALIKLANVMAEVLPNTKNMQEEIPEIYAYMQTSAYGQIHPLTDFLPSNYYAIYGCENVDAYFDGTLALEDITNATTIVTIEARETMKTNPTDPAAWGTVLAYGEGIATLNALDEQGLIEWVAPLRLGTTKTMNSKQAALDKIQEEAIVKIITGKVPVDEFDSFVKEWNARGGAQIAEELAEKLK